MDNTHVIANIKAVLKEREITQAKFCRMAGIDRGTWYHFTRGADIRLGTLRNMANCLGLKTAFILRGEQ